MSKIIYHADDFGVTVEQSKSILECFDNGVLNSVSIIPNSSEAAASFELIKDAVASKDMRLVVHLNFVEGHCMANPEDLPDLVDDLGFFKCTYGSMLKLNYSSRQKIVQEEFKKEILAQINAVLKLTGGNTINVDSHQHYLQIPMIFRAFCEVVQENAYTVDYLRIPVDPMDPLWSTPSLFFKAPLINHVKWALLKFLKPSNKAIANLNCKVPVFFGMPFTCQMTYENVSKLLPKYFKIAETSGRDLELMFHPGAVYNLSDLLDSSQQDLVDFYSSDYRKLEHEALLKFDK